MNKNSEKKYFSIKEASKHSSLSKRLLYQFCADRKLRHSRVRTKIVINIKDLEEFINQGIVEPIDWNEKIKKW